MVIWAGLVALGIQVSLNEATLLLLSSVLPDFPAIAGYLLLSKQTGKKPWKLTKEDWGGWGLKIPRVHGAYRLSHSLAPATLLLAVEVWLVGFPAFSIGWLSHIAWDLGTRAGEFRTAPLYPLSKWAKLGWTDAWDWPLRWMIYSWVAHGVAIALLLAAQSF